jgi:hypothetical protein
VVHLAGAMGKPVFLLDRYDNCWRWLSGREDSPWYPSLRIFRQQRSGEWEPVIARVAAALADVIARRTQAPLSCMDGPRLARSFCDVGIAVWSDHVSGLFVRSDEDRWPRWGYANQVPSIAAC